MNLTHKVQIPRLLRLSLGLNSLLLVLALLILWPQTGFSGGIDQADINADLLQAAYTNRFQSAVQALNSGADVNYHDEAGQTPLSWSVANGNLKLVKYLLQNGADIQFLGKDKTTLLHLAVTPRVGLPPLKPNSKTSINTLAQRLVMVEFLLENKLSPAKVDEFGSLPIHYAAALKGDEQLQVRLLSLLVKYGSPSDTKNKFGRTPLDLATNQAVKSYLSQQVQ